MSTIADRLKHHFKDGALLTQALTHRSFGSHNNERLEFLGDALLSYVVADWLHERFPAATEGQLSRLRASLVRGTTLASIAREIALGDDLIMGGGELKSGGFTRDSILAGALEAVIGAIYLDGGVEASKAQLQVLFADRLEALNLEQDQKDPKTLLQEHLQSIQQPLPVYSVTSVVGAAHEQTFTVACNVDCVENACMGTGSSRRGAEQAAAAIALSKIGVSYG